MRATAQSASPLSTDSAATPDGLRLRLTDSGVSTQARMQHGLMYIACRSSLHSISSRELM